MSEPDAPGRSGYCMRSPADESRRLLQAWELALLRFAVTRDESDRLNVAALASELDRRGGRSAGEETFHFFRRTSAQLCAAINGELENAADILAGFCKQIEAPRLRHAFAAAAAIAHSDPPPSRAARPRRTHDLFRGLPARGSASL
ncbi:MAG TPA: hypothetical protein VNK51_19835 [Bradyrhizobium sp.]|nr:hypothetical protein [Bradyrhizobium sp.]